MIGKEQEGPLLPTCPSPSANPATFRDRLHVDARLEERRKQRSDGSDVIGRRRTDRSTTEPADHGSPVFTDEHVGSVDPAVDDAGVVEVGKRGRDGSDEAGHLSDRQRPGELDRSTGVRQAELPAVAGLSRAQELDDPWVGRSLEPPGFFEQSADVVAGGSLHHDRPDGAVHDLGDLSHIQTIWKALKVVYRQPPATRSTDSCVIQ